MRCAVLMHRLRVAAVVVLAVLLAASLTLHNHSLIPENGSAVAPVCAICAFGAHSAVLVAPLLAVTLIVLGMVALAVEAPVASVVRITATGRAPPRRLR